MYNGTVFPKGKMMKRIHCSNILEEAELAKVDTPEAAEGIIAQRDDQGETKLWSHIKDHLFSYLVFLHLFFPGVPDTKLWTSLTNPDNVACVDAGCNNLLVYDDGSPFTYNNVSVTSRSLVENSQGCFYFDTTTKSLESWPCYDETFSGAACQFLCDILGVVLCFQM